MMVLHPKQETMPREALAQVQLERLQALLARLRRNVRRYRELLGDLRVDTLADLERLPETRPEDLVEGFPYGMFALPLQEVIRLSSTVGPAGRPLVVGHTRNDLTHWARLAARQFAAAGVTANDLIQICFAGGVFGQAMGYMLGAEMLGASVIPEDPYHIDYQLAMLRNYRTTVLVTTPSNARDLARRLDERRIDPPSLCLRTVLLSRPIAAAEREELRAGLQAAVRANFGVAEILDPGLCVECAEGRFHANEDQFIVEARDGELLVTTLAREAMPLLRYRTRVRCLLHRERCPCGRTGVILEPGERTDGRLLVNEMPLYAEQLGAVLSQTRAADFPFRFETGEGRVTVFVEVTNERFIDAMRGLADLRRELQAEFLARLGISAEIRYVQPAGAKGKT